MKYIIKKSIFLCFLLSLLLVVSCSNIVDGHELIKIESFIYTKDLYKYTESSSFRDYTNGPYYGLNISFMDREYITNEDYYITYNNDDRRYACICIDYINEIAIDKNVKAYNMLVFGAGSSLDLNPSAKVYLNYPIYENGNLVKHVRIELPQIEVIEDDDIESDQNNIMPWVAEPEKWPSEISKIPQINGSIENISYSTETPGCYLKIEVSMDDDAARAVYDALVSNEFSGSSEGTATSKGISYYGWFSTPEYDIMRFDFSFSEGKAYIGCAGTEHFVVPNYSINQ